MSPRPSLRLAALAVAVALAAPAAAVPAAPDTAGAARVIRRYVEVTGGAAALSAERTSYTRSTIDGLGFTGTMETWAAPPDRRYSRTVLGPFVMSEGCDRGTSWRTDPTSGRAARLTDRDSLEARVGAWFDLECWALPGLGGGSARVERRERDSTGARTVLAVDAPASGPLKSRLLAFDDATGLLVRELAPHDDAWVVSTFADWRRAAGRLRPVVSVTSISNMPANALRSTADSFAVNVDVSAVPFALPSAAGGSALRWLGANGVARLPFDYRVRHVWLKASLDGGPPEDFLFDTGASASVLDSGYAAAHGIATQGRMQAAGAGAAGGASFASIGSLAVAGPDGDGIEVAGLHPAVMSVNPTLARFLWRDMAGVIGYDVISRFVVTVDYDSSLLILRDPATFTPPPGAVRVPMVLNGPVPAVEATLDGRFTGLFRLDVGSSSATDVHAPFARAHGLERRLRHVRQVVGSGFGGEFEVVLGRLHRIAVGPFSWKDPIVSVARAAEGAFASEDFAGNIGNRLLERFRVTLDYEHRAVWLEPGRRFGERDGVTRTGVLFSRERDTVRVAAVLPGSPGERAGLRLGDVVVSVDGRAIEEWDPTRLDPLFEGGPDGRRVPVRVRREDGEHDFVLILKEMVP